MTPDELTEACLARGITPAAFPSVLDNTILVSWRECKQSCFRAHFQRLKSPGTSPDLHFGAAYALGMETMRRAFYMQGESAARAFGMGCTAASRLFGDYDPGLKRNDTPHTKTWANLMLAFDAYVKRWPLETDRITPFLHGDVPAIEYSFASPMFDQHGEPFAHPDTSDPLLFAGKLDMIGTLDGMSVLPLDDKTAGRTEEKPWRLRSQFMGYVDELLGHGLRCDSFMVRRMVILTKDHKPMEELVPIPLHMVERWRAQRIDTIHDMLARWAYFKHVLEHESDEELLMAFPFAFNDQCGAYGGCAFADLCTSRNPKALEPSFEINTWSPIGHLEENKDATD